MLCNLAGRHYYGLHAGTNHWNIYMYDQEFRADIIRFWVVYLGKMNIVCRQTCEAITWYSYLTMGQTWSCVFSTNYQDNLILYPLPSWCFLCLSFYLQDIISAFVFWMSRKQLQILCLEDTFSVLEWGFLFQHSIFILKQCYHYSGIFFISLYW